MSEPIKVRVRDCPTGLHNGEGDWVLLAPTLSLTGGLAAERDLVAIIGDVGPMEGATEAQIAAAREQALMDRWVQTYLRHGAIGWNLHTMEDGPLPFSPDALLADYAIARPVADAAADLYTDAVLSPFQARLAALSPIGQTGGTTSPRRRPNRKSSASSSPGTMAASAR